MKKKEVWNQVCDVIVDVRQVPDYQGLDILLCLLYLHIHVNDQCTVNLSTRNTSRSIDFTGSLTAEG